MPPRMKGHPDVSEYSKSQASIRLSELLGTNVYVELSRKSVDGTPLSGNLRIFPIPCSYKRFRSVYDIILVHPERTSGDHRGTVIPDLINEGERLNYWALNDLWEVYVDKIYVVNYGTGHSQ